MGLFSALFAGEGLSEFEKRRRWREWGTGGISSCEVVVVVVAWMGMDVGMGSDVSVEGTVKVDTEVDMGGIIEVGGMEEVTSGVDNGIEMGSEV
jgi:hypothetical protein